MGVAFVVAAAVAYSGLRPEPSQSQSGFALDATGSAGPSGIIAGAMSLSDPLVAIIDKPLAHGEGIPSDILEEMQRCLQAKDLSSEGPNAPTVADQVVAPKSEVGASDAQVKVYRTEEALAEIEKELGPAMMQGDLWTDWIVKLPEGMDRKIHLENIEDETGRIQQNLSLFQIDQSGKASRVLLTETEERNPDMAMISNLLNEGEIHRKESSRYYQYARGERLEVIELDGQPTELEIVRDEIFFRCDRLESTKNCTCIR